METLPEGNYQFYTQQKLQKGAADSREVARDLGDSSMRQAMPWRSMNHELVVASRIHQRF